VIPEYNALTLIYLFLDENMNKLSSVNIHQ